MQISLRRFSNKAPRINRKTEKYFKGIMYIEKDKGVF